MGPTKFAKHLISNWCFYRSNQGKFGQSNLPSQGLLNFQVSRHVAARNILESVNATEASQVLSPGYPIRKVFETHSLGRQKTYLSCLGMEKRRIMLPKVIFSDIPNYGTEMDFQVIWASTGSFFKVLDFEYSGFLTSFLKFKQSSCPLHGI